MSGAILAVVVVGGLLLAAFALMAIGDAISPVVERIQNFFGEHLLATIVVGILAGAAVVGWLGSSRP